jgi:hypothetical protein
MNMWSLRDEGISYLSNTLLPHHPIVTVTGQHQISAVHARDVPLNAAASSPQECFHKTDRAASEHDPQDFSLELIESDECSGAHRGGEPVYGAGNALRNDDRRPEDKRQI